MSNIVFIGESHTWFLSGDENAKDMQRKAIADSSMWTPVGTLGQYRKDEIFFLWRIGTTAYSLSPDRLVDICDRFNIKEKDTLLFNFGTIDLNVFLDEYNNTEEVVKKYMDNCYSFARSFNAECRFIGPFYNGLSSNYDVFVNFLISYSEHLGIKPPIFPVGNAIDRHFIPGDTHKHLDWKDLELCLSYIIDSI